MIDRFRGHALVAIDEGGHHNAALHAFLHALLRDPRFPATDLVVEFGSARYQEVIDRYVAGGDVPTEELRQVWRETTQVYVWDNPVYAALFDAVREINRARPPARRLRVLLADPPIDWSRVESFRDWAAFGMRDAHAAGVIEREVLAKGRVALLVFGSMHLQRRAIAANFEPTTDPSAPLVEQLERAHPGVVHTIYATPLAPEAESVVSRHRAPALIRLRDDPVGARDFAAILPPDQRGVRFRVSDGKPARIAPAEYRTFAFRDDYDDLLYLGPAEAIASAPTPPAVYADESYYREVVRRARVLHGMNLGAIEELRRQYESR